MTSVVERFFRSALFATLVSMALALLLIALLPDRLLLALLGLWLAYTVVQHARDRRRRNR